MPDRSDLFRDFGILPVEGSRPPAQVRASFSTGQVVGQYIGTVVVSAFGLGMATILALFVTSFPANVFAATLALVLLGIVLYFATRNDYRWVEISGNLIRAKHLYTGRILERRVEEIKDLFTMTIPKTGLAAAIAAKITEAWLGRIKGIQIRFRDNRKPIPVMRSDPAMANAKELIEAILFRMSEINTLDLEVEVIDGKPLVRRIFFKKN